MTHDDTGSMVDYLKGVYMMTGAASANMIVTHANITPLSTTTWRMIYDSFPGNKNDYLPDEGQNLTINSITNSSLTMNIDGIVVTFTITPN